MNSKAFTLEIHIGLKEGYGGEVHDISEVEEICQEFCNDAGLCVSVTRTRYVYGSPDGVCGREDGAVVGLINYPRFSKSVSELWNLANELGAKLGKEMGQHRISIIGSHKTKVVEFSQQQ